MKVVLLLFFVSIVPRSKGSIEELVQVLFFLWSFRSDVFEPNVPYPDVGGHHGDMFRRQNCCLSEREMSEKALQRSRLRRRNKNCWGTSQTEK